MTALGSDHNGFELKREIIDYLRNEDAGFCDFGCYEKEPADYPVIAKKVCAAILSGQCENGILICGTGVGISIAANRFKGIRAAICRDVSTAVAARDHNDANILGMGAQSVDSVQCIEIIRAFFSTGFSNIERHIRRIGLIDAD